MILSNAPPEKAAAYARRSHDIQKGVLAMTNPNKAMVAILRGDRAIAARPVLMPAALQSGARP